MSSEPPTGCIPRAAVRRWSYFSTSMGRFLAVMGPVTGVMVALACSSRVPMGIRVSGAVVVTASLYAFWRGYLHRIEADERGVRWRALTRRIEIPWEQVRLIGRYTPPDRNGMTQYAFVTRCNTPPRDRRQVDAETLQVQDRPGLVEALEEMRREAATRSAPTTL